jgi:hypothetical protein
MVTSRETTVTDEHVQPNDEDEGNEEDEKSSENEDILERWSRFIDVVDEMGLIETIWQPHEVERVRAMLVRAPYMLVKVIKAHADMQMISAHFDLPKTVRLRQELYASVKEQEEYHAPDRYIGRENEIQLGYGLDFLSSKALEDLVSIQTNTAIKHVRDLYR